MYHPAFPDPYTVCALSSDAFDVLEHNGDAVITLSYNDNLTVAICDKDKDTYIKRLLNLTCYYRQDLKERICTKDINE